jgi:hypothetical protein
MEKGNIGVLYREVETRWKYGRKWRMNGFLNFVIEVQRLGLSPMRGWQRNINNVNTIWDCREGFPCLSSAPSFVSDIQALVKFLSWCSVHRDISRKGRHKKKVLVITNQAEGETLTFLNVARKTAIDGFHWRLAYSRGRLRHYYGADLRSCSSR